MQALIFAALGIFVTGGDVADFDQQRRELVPPPDIAARRQGTQRVAVIALAAGDDVAALWLAYFGEILPRQFEGTFHSFRPA